MTPLYFPKGIFKVIASLKIWGLGRLSFMPTKLKILFELKREALLKMKNQINTMAKSRTIQKEILHATSTQISENLAVID